MRKNQPLKIIQNENKIVYCVEWAKDGKYLATAEYGG